MVNELYTSLRFYDSIDFLNRFRGLDHSYKWRLYEDTKHLPAFQVNTSGGLTSLKLIDLATGAETDVSSDFTNGGGQAVEFSDFTRIYYPRASETTPRDYGHYYLKLTSGSDVLYSEDFIIDNISGKQIITWSNEKDLGGIYYPSSNKYWNKMILDAVVAKPSYPIEEDGNEDGFSNFIPTFQRVYKQWQMWFYAPEWVADACSLIPLHDYVTIYPSYGNGVSYTASDVDFTIEWMENKGLAKITLTFRRDAVVKTYYGNTIT